MTKSRTINTLIGLYLEQLAQKTHLENELRDLSRENAQLIDQLDEAEKEIEAYKDMDKVDEITALLVGGLDDKEEQ